VSEVPYDAQGHGSPSRREDAWVDDIDGPPWIAPSPGEPRPVAQAPVAQPPWQPAPSPRQPQQSGPQGPADVVIGGAEVSPVSGVPQWSVSAPPDPLFGGGGPNWQPRIVPSPAPQRGRLVTGIVAGLAAGLLLFGVTGFFVGRAMSSVPPKVATPQPSASAASTLSVFQQAQETANRRKLPAGLAAIAASWLPYVGECGRDGEGSLALSPGEKARLRCHQGDVVVTFVEYKSTAERDKVRFANLGKNIDARELTPGVAAQREGPTPSHRMSGDYVEYAYKYRIGKSDLTVAALWWDDADAPVGAYLLAYWQEKMGASWAPLRDLWAAHA
jgi:hypothetical protein